MGVVGLASCMILARILQCSSNASNCVLGPDGSSEEHSKKEKPDNEQ